MNKNFLKNSIICEDMKWIYKQGMSWDKLKNSHILITGAYGMIASYLVYFLIYLNEYHDYNINIWVIVRNIERLDKRFGEFAKREYFHCILGGLEKPFTCDVKMDYIIHAASLASPQYYNTIPVEVMIPNVIGTYWLLEYAKICRPEKFLFFSSSEIYGKQDDRQITNYQETVLGVLDPADVRNCYAEAKRMGESMCVDYYHEFGVPINSVRIFHTFGPTMDIRKDERAFSEFVANVIDGKNIEMKSEGTAKRPFCYLTDAVLAFFTILFNGDAGESYNLCNENNYISIAELAEILVRLFPERELKVERKERDEKSNYIAKKDENQVTASSNKLKRIGWTPQITVEEGFERTIRGLEEEM